MKIVLESKMEQLATVEQLVDSIAEKISIEGDVYANILIGVTEAVSNAIVHGNKMDVSKTVSVEYSYCEKNVVFIITDQGSGFNYYSVPDPTLPENIEKEDGRGIFLMNSLADEVVYNDKGNEVSLKFYIN
jgi:serine/threonine-protein kinase RsbW